jgi:glucose-6-phosphate isomerase
MVNRQINRLPESLESAVKASLEDWRAGRKVERLWAGDATLWTGADERNWLGWLGVVEDEFSRGYYLSGFAAEIKSAGVSHALLLGMGGSSLCPEVMAETFGRRDDYPELLVLDSTDPAQIQRFESRVDIANTLFIVSSKSGATLEPNILMQHFFERARRAVGADRAGERFIAITDPGSNLQQVAQAKGFRHVFFGLPSIGGRYSALSDFGMVPSAITGVDVLRFLGRAEEMVRACKPHVPVEDNPGVALGVILGALCNSGRDKVTIIASPGISDFGAWVEQLLAESTGKDGKGLITIERESPGPPEVYGNDRLFVYVRLAAALAASQDAAVDALERAGHPVVCIPVIDAYDLGQEFFRWEFATAVAGSIIGINPFNQPDVEASKVATRELTDEYEKTGSLPPEEPILEDVGIKLFTDRKNAASLSEAAGHDRRLVAYLKGHLDRLAPGDYFAILAYLDMNDSHRKELQAMRHAVRDVKRVATCLGFGPRFLHSTGQLYKGGPNTGVFLQITCDDAVDLPVPGRKFTFGVVKAAQARGDFRVLVERGRRALRVHLGADVQSGLATLRRAIEQALA